MTTVEIIDRQIEEAANFLAHAKTMKNRDRDMDRAFAALLAMSGRLIEIVQNQQRLIGEIQKESFDAAVEAVVNAEVKP